MIYLDNAATTKPMTEVLDAMNVYYTNRWHNPSSLYKEGKAVKADIDKAAEQVATLIGANPDDIFFTSGGSESNNWALQGFVNQCRMDKVRPIIITSVIEHNSIKLCVESLKRQGVNVELLNVNAKGFVNLEKLKELLAYYTDTDFYSPYRILVSIQYANNEIGTVQHIGDICNLAHRYGAIVHTDAVQAYGHIYMNGTDVDLLSASGHKIGAVKGVGFLYIRNEYQKFIAPLVYGTQNRNMRGGTENVAAIIGMGVAAHKCLSSVKYLNKFSLAKERRDTFQKLLKEYNIDCFINGDSYYRLPNNISLTFNHNITGEALIYMLETDGYAISAGSACDSHSNQPSFVLKAIGLTDKEATRTIRLSLPEDKDFTATEFSDFCSCLSKSIRILES